MVSVLFLYGEKFTWISLKHKEKFATTQSLEFIVNSWQVVMI